MDSNHSRLLIGVSLAAALAACNAAVIEDSLPSLSPQGMIVGDAPPPEEPPACEWKGQRVPSGASFCEDAATVRRCMAGQWEVEPCKDTWTCKGMQGPPGSNNPPAQCTGFCENGIVESWEECDGLRPTPTGVGTCEKCKFACPVGWQKSSDVGGFFWCPVIPNKAGINPFTAQPNGRQDNSIRYPSVDQLDAKATIHVVEPPAEYSFFRGPWPNPDRTRFDHRKKDAEEACLRACGDGSVECNWEEDYTKIPLNHRLSEKRSLPTNKVLGCRRDEPNCCSMPDQKRGSDEFTNIDANSDGMFECSSQYAVQSNGVSSQISTAANANVPGQLTVVAKALTKRGSLCTTEGEENPTLTATKDASAVARGMATTNDQRYFISNASPGAIYDVEWILLNTPSDVGVGELKYGIKVGEDSYDVVCNERPKRKVCPNDPAEGTPPGLPQPENPDWIPNGCVNWHNSQSVADPVPSHGSVRVVGGSRFTLAAYAKVRSAVDSNHRGASIGGVKQVSLVLGIKDVVRVMPDGQRVSLGLGVLSRDFSESQLAECGDPQAARRMRALGMAACLENDIAAECLKREPCYEAVLANGTVKDWDCNDKSIGYVCNPGLADASLLQWNEYPRDPRIPGVGRKGYCGPVGPHALATCVTKRMERCMKDEVMAGGADGNWGYVRWKYRCGPRCGSFDSGDDGIAYDPDEIPVCEFKTLMCGH